MARKPGSGAETGRHGWRIPVRYWLAALGLCLLAVLALFLLSRLDQFLAGNPRFVLPAPEDPSVDTPYFRVEGAVHASRGRIAGVFASDFGHSVYLMPLEERRAELRAIDWVKDASISRLWPNRAVVRIVERTPVAFVRIPGPASSYQMALIDADGVFLPLPPQARFTLPVLKGVRADQNPQIRRDRVQRALRLTKELGDLAAPLSEIDASDPENLRVTQPVENRAVTVLLGSRSFLPRLQTFLAHYPDIRRRLPNATVFDLRIDGRITALQEGSDGE